MDAYNQVILGESLEIDEARQMKDPKKDSMVSKGGKTIVIDKSKEKEYLKKGWQLAEKKKLDPVDDAENDKKFKDRKDKDIDNDGDVDSSDEYLHKKRKATDDAIDGGKKPAKKEDDEEGDDEEEKEVPKVAGKKDDKKKVASNAKTAEISKIGEDIDLTDATTDLLKMWESAAKKSVKGATDTGEEIDSKDSPKSKEFTAAHKKSDKKIEDNEEDGHDKTFKAQGGTTPKSGKRPQDNAAGDTKIVKSTEVKEEVELEEDVTISIVEGKLKAGRGRATIDIDHTVDGIEKAEKKFKIKFKSTRNGWDLSGQKKDILAYLQSKDYDMDSEDIEELYPELMEALEEGLKTTHVVVDTAQGNKIVSTAAGSNAEKNLRSSIASAEKPPMNIKDKKTLKIVKLKKPTNKDLTGTTLKEETAEDIIAQAQDIINGKTVSEIAELGQKDKNPHDARTREAKAFLKRMALKSSYSKYSDKKKGDC